jgi:outer membrane protein assembly factor BamB
MKTNVSLTPCMIAVIVLFFSATAVFSAELGPVACWDFAEGHLDGSALVDTIGGYRAELQGEPDFLGGDIPALALDGQTAFLSVNDPPEVLLPHQKISVEAWVRLNAGQSWGGLMGYFQDNGSFEKGWLLGYNSTTFTFSVSTGGTMQYLPGKTAFGVGQWYHVVGTYDGDTLKLYVNGQLESSQSLRGAIDYPPEAFFTIGAYNDENELYPTHGLLHQVALYADAIDVEQIQAHYGAQAPASNIPLELELGPYVQYVTPSEAVVHWWTKEACSSILEYGLAGPGAKYSPRIQLDEPHQGDLGIRAEDAQPKTRHALSIEGLRPNEVYAYRVKAVVEARERSTDVYELDTALNYSVRPLPANVPFSADSTRHGRAEGVVNEILKQGVTKGYCLVWGLVDGSLAHALAANTELTVVALDEDADRVAAVRRRLYEAGVYGTRITAQHIETLAEVPYPSNFANLIVSERMLFDDRCPGQAAEMFRLLRPRDGIGLLSCSSSGVDAVSAWLTASLVDFRNQSTEAGPFCIVEKQVLPGIGSWTHQYGDAGNTADSHDELGGATGTDDLQVQWLGKPGADFGADRNPRMPAPLAANGRLFHQGMNRMVALDSYNGSILWSLEIPGLQRVNLPRDASNWCTDSDALYVAIQEKCWQIEHRSGDLEHVFELPAGWPGQEYDWGYVAQKDGVLLASVVRKGTVYTDFWGGASWYDKTSGYGTEKVCSDMLFAYDLDTRELLWTRQNGLVINTTLAVSAEAVFFVESRNERLKGMQSRRLNDWSLWSDQYLVALDPRTGQPRWEKPIDTADGIVVFFLACTDEAVVIASSAAGKYHLYRFDAETGAQQWHAEHSWPNDNHSGHMQHPVVLADSVFLEPCGYDLKTGQRITSGMGRHEGCATYCGTKHALLYRGQSRRVAMWDIGTGEVSSWYNLRPSCWLSTIAGEGMVLSPEGGGGCSCGNWLETSLAFAPVAQPGQVNAAPVSAP